MKTVRYGAFETNSSSMHALVVSTDYVARGKLPKKVTASCGYDFSERKYVPHTSSDAKASLIYMGIINIFGSNLIEVDWNFKKHIPIPVRELTQEEIKHNDAVLKAFGIWKKFFETELFRKYEIPLEYDDTDLCMKRAGEEPKDNDNWNWGKTFNFSLSMNGYMANSNVVLDELVCGNRNENCIKRLINDIEEGIDEDKAVNTFTERYSFYDTIEFIINPKSVFLQGSDEMSKRESEKQRKTVLKMVKKNRGNCDISWIS